MAMIGVWAQSRTPRARDRGGRLESVHLGHLHVHQHGIERLPDPGRPTRLAAVPDHHNLMAPLLQQADRQPLIDRVVLGQQEPEPRGLCRRAVGRRCGAVRRRSPTCRGWS